MIMPFLEVAQNRYTTKTYNGEIIPEETLHVLKEILRLAPSSINSQPWQFIFVGDEHKNEIFAPLSLMNEERVKQASHIVIFRVLESVEHFEEEAPSYISEGGRTFYQQYIKPQGEAHVKAWMEHQVYVALGYFSFLPVPLWALTRLRWKVFFLKHMTNICRKDGVSKLSLL